MLGKVIPLILLSFMALSTSEPVFERKEAYSLSDEINTLSALWAGDLEGDHTPEILAGGILFEAGVTRGALLIIRRNEVSILTPVSYVSRTLVMTVCNAIEGKEKEIVVGSRGLFIYSRAGKLLNEKSTGGDVTALQAVNFDETEPDEIIYGTSAGDVVYLSQFETEYRFSIGKTVNFILVGDENTFYVVTSHSISCRKANGEQVWLHTVKDAILSAVCSDINADGKKEVVYVSGSAIFSLSL